MGVPTVEGRKFSMAQKNASWQKMPVGESASWRKCYLGELLVGGT